MLKPLSANSFFLLHELLILHRASFVFLKAFYLSEMKRTLILVALLALAAFSGCVQQDIRPAAAKLPEISACIQQHPEEVMTALFMNKDAVTLMIKDIRSDCGEETPIAPYWYLTLRTDAGVFEFYIDEAVQNVLCVVEPKKLPELGECATASECDDADPSTKDECVGRPKKCVNTPINECADNDGYCPEGCSYAWDNDCPAVDQCQSDFDCIDSNNLTKDTCSGTPKTCHYELKSCEELEKYLCEQYEVCDETILPTTDSGICCAVPCSKTESCEGVTCAEEQKCVRGNCIDKSCAERELPLCVPGEVCIGDYFKDTFDIVCCTGECRRPCDSDANCDAGEVCDPIQKYCIVKSCSDLGGKTCNATTEKCTGEKERTVDNEECCLECTLKTCEQRGGIVCDATKGEKCSQSAVESFDEPECCLAECQFDWCIGRRCAINRKCVEEKCILKTCEEMGGIDWDWLDRQLCKGKFYHTSGAWDCCIEMTCEEMNGIECQATETCEGETRRSTDADECCIGTCVE